MKTSSAKAKGRNLQQFLRKGLLKTFPTLEPDDVRSTSMGVSGEDVQLSPAARKLIPYSFECKSRAKMAIYSFWEQAETNTPNNCKPVLVVKANRKDPLVVLDFNEFMRLIK